MEEYWHNRWWLHKTRTGRVVYDRKPHIFTWKDLNRVFKRVFEDWIDDEEMLGAYLDFIARVGTSLHNQFEFGGLGYRVTKENESLYFRALSSVVDSAFRATHWLTNRRAIALLSIWINRFTPRLLWLIREEG